MNERWLDASVNHINCRTTLITTSKGTTDKLKLTLPTKFGDQRERDCEQLTTAINKATKIVMTGLVCAVIQTMFAYRD